MFLSIDSVRGVKEVATNTFYVKIKPGSDAKQNPNDLAHQIARRNGFHNLGPVRHTHTLGPFINNVRNKGGTHVRTDANKGEGRS